MKTTGITDIADSDIAVIGIACYFPGARNSNDFWQNLRAGKESITKFSDNEIIQDRALLAQDNYVKAGSILSNVDTFDAAFFGYSPKEAETMDPQQRIFLECAWQAMDDAGYNSTDEQLSIGVYAGCGPNTYLYNNLFPNYHFANDRSFFEPMNDLHLTLGNEKDFLSTRIAYQLNLRGPSVNVQTACSTSLVAVHLANQALLSGECDMALAGGVSIRIPQHEGYLHQDGMIFSPDGHCRAFDAKAQGTVFGNGAGIVVLKLLSDAIADGDNIHAVIKGSAINNDGARKIGFTAPSVEGQATVVAEALAVANVAAETISYIEAHGTGTAVGDPIEIDALNQVFNESTNKKGFCAIGSVKTNIGHLMMAAGMAGLIKTILSLKYQQIPPSLHFNQPNPQIDFANSPFYVNTQLSEWKSHGTSRRAGVSSFGMGGTNAHIVLQEAPKILSKKEADRDVHVLTLSAKCQPALQQLMQDYYDYLHNTPEIAFANICFTANVGRKHFDHRFSLVAESAEQCGEQLSHLIKQSTDSYHSQTGTKQIAFLFTGQGSQYKNMGYQLYLTQPVFRQTLEKCNSILSPYLKKSLIDILYPSSAQQASLLNQTVYTQPAIFALEYALYKLWKSWGIEPDVVLGHSLGEYVAACVAGVFTLEDALLLVAERARLMHMLPQKGMMLAIYASKSFVLDNIQAYPEQVTIAAVNALENVVISGEKSAIETIQVILQNKGVKTKKLAVSHAFHSPLMAPILSDFENLFKKINFSKPHIKLISNRTGTLSDETLLTANYWCQHISQPVEFTKCMTTLQQLQMDVLLELGAKPILLGIGRQCLPDHTGLWLPSLRPGKTDWQVLSKSISELYNLGVFIDWKAFERGFKRQRVSLPSYPFQRQRYWIEADINQYQKNRSGHSNKFKSHPLLGEPIHLAKQESNHYFESQINPSWQEHAYLVDHAVSNTVIMPLTGYLEMAWAAGLVLFNSKCFVLKHVFVHQPLILPNNETQCLQISLKPGNDDNYSFEIFSRQAHNQNKPIWSQHISGQLHPMQSTWNDLPIEHQQGQINLKILQADCTEEVIPEDFYNTYYMDYGETFKSIHQLFKNKENTCILGKIHVPKIILSDYKYYSIHPAVLDAAAHIVGELFPRENYLPMLIEQLILYRSPEDKLWSYAKVRPQSALDNETISADICLFDETGNAIASLLGLTVKRVSSAYLESGSKIEELISQITWQPQDLSIKPVDNNAKLWLVFVDQKEIGSHTIDILRNIGHSLVLVSHGTTYQQIKRTHYCLNPFEAKDFIRLFEAITLLGTKKLGILHLWSLDEAMPDSSDSNTEISMLSCGSIMHLLQALCEFDLNPQLYLVTQGAQYVAKHALYHPQQTPVWGLSQVIRLEYPEFNCITIDLDPSMHPYLTAQQLTTDLLSCGTETQLSYRQGRRYVSRLQNMNDTASQIPSFDVFQVKMSAYGLLENLALRQKDEVSINADEVEIQVKAAGLNFRDVLNVLGMLQTYYADQLGIEHASDVPLGFECSGTIIKVGSAVTDFKLGDDIIALAEGSFSNRVIVSQANIALKPKQFSYTEAATIPVAFSTAYYALHHLAKINANDQILIHAAAGGVGLAAVQIAQRAGAKIIATASPTKQDYLKAIGVDHVMDSRSLDFAEEIEQLTNGQGVSIVLNSLTGDFIDRSFASLSHHGRFIELGKLNIWSNEKVHSIYPNVSYFPFDFREESITDKMLISTVFTELKDAFNDASLQPLPYTTFAVEEVVNAFRMMQQAKHIGKIILTMPDSLDALSKSPESKITPDGSYLITGGLGGLGLKVANWLVKQGAHHLVLSGRQGAESNTAKTAIASFRQRGVKIIVTPSDVSQQADVKHLLKQCHKPLRGIVHAAGVIQDDILEKQSLTTFSKVMAPKISGAWHLHQLSLSHPLDFFICFSSTTAIFGAIGQSNYAAANAFLDGLAHYRHGQGLPSLTINWGGWAEVGMAARLDQRIQQYFSDQGVNFMPPEQALKAMEKLMTQPMNQAIVTSIQWDKWLAQFSTIDPFYENFILTKGNNQTNLGASIDFMKQFESSPANKCRNLLITHVREMVNKVLGGDSKQQLGLQQGFFDYGMDSLTSIELRNYLQSSLNCSLPSTLAFNYPTIEALVDYLLKEVFTFSEQTEAALQDDQKESLTTEINALSEEDAEALLMDELEKNFKD